MEPLVCNEVLALTPFQLAAQNLEEGFSHTEESDCVFRFSTKDAIVALNGNSNLAVNGEECFFVVALDYQLHFGGVPNNERAMSKRVRTDGCDHEGVHTGHKYRSTGSERVRGRAGRGRDNYPVSFVFENVGVVDEQVESDETGDGALIYNNVVQGEVGVDAFSLAHQAALEHRPRFQRASRAVDLLERLV